jgi:hypothetical protein
LRLSAIGYLVAYAALTSSKPSLPAWPRMRNQNRVETINVAAANVRPEKMGIQVLRTGST